MESFGRVILEAMAAGVPVVLPESFRPLFGDAATYARPSEVRMVVDRLWQDDDHYATRAAVAQQFVERRFGYRRHAERLERLVSRPCR